MHEGELLLRDVLLQWLSLMDLDEDLAKFHSARVPQAALPECLAQVPQVSQGVQLDRYRLYK